jgi:serine/threonine-protein kinase
VADRFTPGQILGGRYRIIGLLGLGGMGEVYRADDLRLGTAVALKFLPLGLERDPVALERLRGEVRTARQVSHPHVCRVYDIDEVEGRAFLSMEYVDGEDLRTLLRRIGRLPPAKAIEISLQLCAGLAAAHDKGVLHRDLKPANVMIDGHGRVRIADFGLAVASEDAVGGVEGTPAYMAPEQLARNPATVQTDIYALGLVLYEIFTGTRAFEAKGLDEWLKVHTETPPTAPSHHTRDLDPATERVILRCLEKAAADRPRSVAQVAGALPGGDPMAAALAAGDTPSPEMVAAAGGDGALVLATAWSLLAAVVVLLGLITALSPSSTDLGLAPMKKNPAVLVDRAQAILDHLGYTDPAGDGASWLERDHDSVRWMADHLPSREWRRRLASIGSPVLLYYRRGDTPLAPQQGSSVVTTDNPPVAEGNIQVVLDAEGRLRTLQVMSPRWSVSAAGATAYAVEPVFEETGLDRLRFEPAPAEWLPPVPFDRRLEWTGTRAAAPEIPLRLSVASFNGRLVSVAVLGPWNATAGPVAAVSRSAQIRGATFAVVTLLLMAVMTAFARRNLRAGRGDRAGAGRLSLASFTLGLANWLALAHWPSLSPDTVTGLVFVVLSAATFPAVLMWLFYIACEPYVRRRLPRLLVGWARLLDGRVGDPRVGRDVLLGLVAGMALATADHLVNALPTWFSFSGQTTIPFFSLAVPWGLSARLIPGAAPLAQLAASITYALFMVGTLFTCRMLIPRPALAVMVTGVVFTMLALGGENPILETPSAILHGVSLALVTAHLGLLPLIVTLFVDQALVFGMPVGVGFSEWYAPHAIASIALILVIAIWSFVLSLGGRPALASLKLDD